MTKSILSLNIDKQYLHYVSFSPDAALPQVFNKTKDQKIIRKDQERVLEFCVRFASILKMSNEMNFWTTGTKHQPLDITLLDDDMSFSGICTFCLAVNTM